MCEEKRVFLFPELRRGMNASQLNAPRLAVCEQL